MSTLTPEDLQLLAANPALTQGDIQTYHVNKVKLFKFTIAICAIYGSFTLLLILLSIFYPQINTLYGVDIKPFIITFIVCMIIVISILVIIIVGFKPLPLSEKIYDNDICPDYWTLVPTNTKDDLIYRNAASNIQPLLQYQCVPDSNVWQMYTNINGASTSGTNPYGLNVYGLDTHGKQMNNNNISTSYVVTNNSNTINQYAFNNLIGTQGTNGTLTSLTNTGGASSYANIGASNLLCDRVFPNYLAAMNAQDSTLQPTPNALSCTYASACGIPWTNLCGN